MVAEHKASPSLLPQEPHLDGPGRVGVLDQVGADVIQNAPDVLRPHGQEHILAAQLQRTGKAALLQHLHHLGQRLLKDLGEAGRGIQLHHGVPGDQRVLEQIVGQLLDLPGLAVDLCQIFALLGLGLVFVVAQDLGIEQQGGQRGAQVVGHLSDQALDLGGSLSLLGLLLAQGQTQTIQTGGQQGQLIVSLDRDGVVKVAALHGLDLPAEQEDITDDFPAAQEEKQRKKGKADKQQDLAPLAVIGIHAVVIEHGCGLFVRKGERVHREPALGRNRFRHIFPPLVDRSDQRIGGIEHPGAVVDDEHRAAVPHRPVVQLVDIPAGKTAPVDIALQLLHLLFHSLLLGFRLVKIKPQGFVQHDLHSHQKYSTCQC